MNNLIEKIEISSFRSIEKISIKVSEINVFSGSNDVGKSNILKALNLFFNNQTDFLKPLKFDDDYNMVSRAKAIKSSKGKQLIKIRLYLNAPESYKSLNKKDEIYLERQFDRLGNRIEKYPPFKDDDNKKKTAISRLINKVRYIYIPALKGEIVLQHLLSLIGEQELVSENDIITLNENIKAKTVDLQDLLNNSGIDIGTNFGLPTLLSDFWQKLSVNTTYEMFNKLDNEIKGSNNRPLNKSQFNISLLNRGEGIKSKYIPPLLKWLDKTDKSKVFIWGIDEPENSLEFNLSDKLSRLYFNDYACSNQIFLTSHSLAFINPPKDIKVKPSVYKIYQDGFGVTKYEDFDSLFKKTSKIDLYNELGILIAQKEFIDTYRSTLEERDNFKSIIDKNNLPLIIVEGKTDKWILEKAWSSLYGDASMNFEIIPSGFYVDENESNGNAKQIKASLEFVSNATKDKIIIGVFDHDREGKEQFLGLSKTIFEYHKKDLIIKKHKLANVYGILLPIPETRTKFTNDRNVHLNFLEIEHFFDDKILQRFNLKGDYILGSEVFEIKNNNKTKFAKETINTLELSDFQKFEIIFNKINEIINQ